jgi:murein DD-endopeptidase MepM/ murein hydrolase activator NlpD
MPPLICLSCRCAIRAADQRFVLVRGARREQHCSESCLRASVRRHRSASAARKRRWLFRLASLAAVATGAHSLWRHHRMPQPVSIAFDPTGDVARPPARREPPTLGPAWPPTDDDWRAAFARATWVYPLPGPARRAPRVDCREEGHCGVDLGGELWGEHVYAALDGVVDRVQARAGSDERGGAYVRLAHFGGMVFTHYTHLAAVPRGMARGARVKAGDLIGLVGDSPERYLYFALSIRPSSEFAEVYWDPSPFMSAWPLRLPAHGTVAGFVP